MNNNNSNKQFRSQCLAAGTRLNNIFCASFCALPVSTSLSGGHVYLQQSSREDKVELTCKEPGYEVDLS